MQNNGKRRKKHVYESLLDYLCWFIIYRWCHRRSHFNENIDTVIVTWTPSLCVLLFIYTIEEWAVCVLRSPEDLNLKQHTHAHMQPHTQAHTRMHTHISKPLLYGALTHIHSKKKDHRAGDNEEEEENDKEDKG